MRALLVAMDRWVRQGVAPPASQIPRIADGTLVPAERVAFPAIPGMMSPRTVDDDENERTGIRFPDVVVPLATYTSWNFRNASIGGTRELVSLMGSAIPFQKKKAAHQGAQDPRRSIEERYTSRHGHLGQVRDVADDLEERASARRRRAAGR